MLARILASIALACAMLLGAAPSTADEIPRDPDDILADWNPGPDWSVALTFPIAGPDLLACNEGIQTEFSSPSGAYAAVYWVRCPDARSAEQFINGKWINATRVYDANYAFSPDIDRAERFALEGGGSGVGRSWVQGNVYLWVARTCPTGPVLPCEQETIAWAQQIAAMLPGEPAVDRTLETFGTGALFWFLLVPIGTFLLLIVPKRVLAWLRSRGYEIETTNPRFVPVDAMVRRARISRLARRTIVVVVTLVLYVIGLFAITSLANPILLGVHFFLGLFVIGFVVNLLLRLVWRPNRLIRVARRRTKLSPLGILGVVLRGSATAIAVFALLLYLFSSLLLITDASSKTPQSLKAGQSEMLATGQPLAIAFAVISIVAHALEDSGTYALLFVVMLAVPTTIAYLIDRLGRRLVRRGLQDTLEQDQRPYFLYLRGFDEDLLRIDESVGRRGFVEILTPFGRPRFEELLVEYLNQFGPVIAIAGGRQVLADLGAAKVSFADDEWQRHVREWVSGARAVVMSATPKEVRPGLEWEMEHLATGGTAKRIMLVLAPWSREAVPMRWGGFLERAKQWPLFAALEAEPMPSGVEVLTWSAERGWYGYGARRRWDWTYAASILTAADRGDLGDDLVKQPKTERTDAVVPA